VTAARPLTAAELPLSWLAGTAQRFAMPPAGAPHGVASSALPELPVHAAMPCAALADPAGLFAEWFQAEEAEWQRVHQLAEACPVHFVCPISLEIMHDPVVLVRRPGLTGQACLPCGLCTRQRCASCALSLSAVVAGRDWTVLRAWQHPQVVLHGWRHVPSDRRAPAQHRGELCSHCGREWNRLKQQVVLPSSPGLCLVILRDKTQVSMPP